MSYVSIDSSVYRKISPLNSARANTKEWQKLHRNRELEKLDADIIERGTKMSVRMEEALEALDVLKRFHKEQQKEVEQTDDLSLYKELCYLLIKKDLVLVHQSSRFDGVGPAAKKALKRASESLDVYFLHSYYNTIKHIRRVAKKQIDTEENTCYFFNGKHTKIDISDRIISEDYIRKLGEHLADLMCLEECDNPYNADNHKDRYFIMLGGEEEKEEEEEKDIRSGTGIFKGLLYLLTDEVWENNPFKWEYQAE